MAITVSQPASGDNWVLPINNGSPDEMYFLERYAVNDHGGEGARYPRRFVLFRVTVRGQGAPKIEKVAEL